MARRLEVQMIPAIRLAGGECVGLGEGDGPRDPEPVPTARRLQRGGAEGLHLWDLDGAGGEAVQFLDIIDIIMAVSIPVQVRGGVRTLQEAGQILSRGAARVVVEEADLHGDAHEWATRLGQRLVVALQPDGEASEPAGQAWAERCAGLCEDGLSRFLVHADSPAASIDLGLLQCLVESGAAVLVGGCGVGDRQQELQRLGVEALVLDHPLWEQSRAAARKEGDHGHE